MLCLENAIPEETVSEVESMFAGVFTREQIKGTLENYKQFDDCKDQAIAQLTHRKAELERKGQANRKI